MSACGFEHDDGAYVLGALSPADRAAFEQHLPGCADCQRAVSELAGLPGLLSRVPVAVLDDELPLPVPDTLLPGLLRKARRTQRRRTFAIAGLAAAAVAAVSIGTAVITHDDTNPASTIAAAQRFHAVGPQALSGWVSLTPVAWGTRLDLTCKYADSGYVYPTDYTMVVTLTDGTSETVTSWKALPGKALHLSAGTSADVDEIADVSVRNAEGSTVLRLH